LMLKPVDLVRIAAMETIVSGIAAMLTTADFIPQAYKIIHSRETAGVSLWMHVTFAIGVAFWFALGIMLWNWPMIIANVCDLRSHGGHHHCETLLRLKWPTISIRNG
jgi:MtN3 and saliva related transmembrane protein